MLLAAVALAQDPSCPATPTPGGDWPVSAVADTAAIDALLFPPGLDRADPERRGVRTDGVVVVHRGEVVYERYGGGWTAERPHLTWSVSKSFVNALVGVAVKDGLLSIDDSVCELRPDLPAPSCAVTVRHLLEFSSGFDWREDYEDQPPTTSSVLAMLYGVGSADMAAFVAGHALRDPPGTTWMYSSGDTNLLSSVVGAALAPRYGDAFPWATLFDRIGMSSATWERDGHGTYVGSSYVWATPRDLARFGQLLLADGCWGGARVLPEGWVRDSTEVNPPIEAKPLRRDDGDVQGRQFWLNRPIPEVGQVSRPWPNVPEDAYAAMGHWKQSITVIPSKDLVVVRVADDRDGTWRHDAFLAAALALVEGR